MGRGDVCSARRADKRSYVGCSSVTERNLTHWSNFATASSGLRRAAIKALRGRRPSLCDHPLDMTGQPGLLARSVVAAMPESQSEPPDPLDGIEQSLEELQNERRACWEQLRSLLAAGPAADAEISAYLQRIEAINEVMLSLARATTV